MNTKIPQFAKLLSQAIASFRVKSVVDPLIKLLVVMIILVIITAWLKLPEWLSIVLLCFSGLVLLLLLCSYIGFAIFKPDYLRSESYNLRKQSLSILGDKDNYKCIDMRHVVDIANPYLENKEEKEEKGAEDE